MSQFDALLKFLGMERNKRRDTINIIALVAWMVAGTTYILLDLPGVRAEGVLQVFRVVHVALVIPLLPYVGHVFLVISDALPRRTDHMGMLRSELDALVAAGEQLPPFNYGVPKARPAYSA